MSDDKVKKLSSASEGDDKRGRSTIEFPYLDLDDAFAIASGVHQIGGSGCEWDQLAAHLKQSAKGGGFRLRMITAKMFGLLNYDRGSITLTPLGMRITDAPQAKQARVEAFLNVALYKTVYDRFRGVSLPPPAGLEREMETLGVAPKQKDKARQVFMRAAKQAGFFEFGTDRLVLPSGTSSQAREGAPKGEEFKGESQRNGGSPGGGGGGTGGGSDLHPFIQGLLKTLPEPESDWAIEQRLRWLQTAAGIFDLIYKGNDEGQKIDVRTETNG